MSKVRKEYRIAVEDAAVEVEIVNTVNGDVR
jgi:hypothetical protein